MGLFGCPWSRVLYLVLAGGVALALMQDGGGTLKEEEGRTGDVGRRRVPLQERPRRFDGVFPCPCSANNCLVDSNDKNDAVGQEVISSACYLPSTDPGKNENNNNSTEATHGNINGNETALATDYCSFSPNHALCRYSADKAGPKCVKPLKIGLSAQEKTEALRIHNELRLRVAKGEVRRGQPGPQPPAADMMELVWDEELSRIVQAWINQCIFEHDCGKCRQTSRFGVGQNLYSAGNFEQKPVDWTRPMMAFFDEVDLMDRNEVNSFLGNRGVGHYTQIVWGATTHVGCGYIAYNDNRYFQSYYACNYGRAGNYVSQKVYNAGPACSKCPPGTSCSSKYKGLSLDLYLGNTPCEYCI
ncbi:venom allergen 5-like [Penaeus japonicus]|uniref:venom allergen 5-like n=1 Tax=Penaeus japonicus TaxID=27405 RepID=UPI001C7146F3|nr:venom allergen 5-like [Penaeus japonicus]